MSIVFEIPASKLKNLAYRVARVAARARKNGLTVPQIQTLSQYGRTFEVHDALAKIRGAESNTRTVSLPMVRILLEGFAPEIGEWKIVGYRSTHRRVDGNYIYSNVGSVPEAKRTEALCCDHCGFKRSRASTFIVERAVNGDTVEVGSTCSDAFFGYSGGSGLAQGLVETGSILREAEESSKLNFLSLGLDMEEEVRTVLAVANRRVSDFGFISSATARIEGSVATWRDVYEDLVSYRRDNLEDADILITAADFMAADEMTASYVDGDPTSQFAYAVKETLERGLAGLRDVSILTAAVHVCRENLRIEEEKRRQKTICERSRHVGELGSRIEFLGKVYRVSSYDGEWGRTYYITMFDPDGNMLHWKTNSAKGLKEGDAYELKGTVKKHRLCEKGSFEGVPETVVSRVSIISELGAATFGKQESSTVLPEEDADALDSFLSTRMSF